MMDSTGIVDVDIDPDQLYAEVLSEMAGAVVTFAGVVRNHDHGKAVIGIDYVGHPSANALLHELVTEFSQREGIHALAAQHRVGHLDIGGIAMYVAVSASHRKEAFDCVEEFVDRVKAVLPIWKKQYLVDGTHEWSECP